MTFTLIRLWSIRWWNAFVLFWTGNIRLGQISYKKSKLFQMKVGTRTNLNMLNLMMMFICLALDGKYPFWANLIFTIKVGTEPNSNILNLVALFNFFFCTGNTHCVKGVQIQSFFWSVISRIRTEYGELRSISPYSVRMRENTNQKKLRIWTLFTQWLFLGNFGQKEESCLIEMKLGALTNSDILNSMVMLVLSFWTGNTLFWQIWSKKSKLSILYYGVQNGCKQNWSKVMNI